MSANDYSVLACALQQIQYMSIMKASDGEISLYLGTDVRCLLFLLDFKQNQSILPTCINLQLQNFMKMCPVFVVFHTETGKVGRP
jgi:hypothetical protein